MSKRISYISDFLIKTIIGIIENHNKLEKSINITVKDIKDFLEYSSKEENTNDLIYEIAGGKRKNIAKFIMLIINATGDIYKKQLLGAINTDKNIFFFEKELINKFQNRYHLLSERDKETYIQHLEYLKKPSDLDEYIIIDSKQEGNIFFYEEYVDNSKAFGIINRVSFNSELGLLIYNSKKSNFAGSVIQKAFISELYKNMNKPLTNDEIKKVGVNNPIETLKNIRKKLESENGINKFNGLETRALIYSFTYKNIKYFIMNG